MRYGIGAGVLAAMLAVAPASRAQQTDLERKVDALTREVEALKQSRSEYQNRTAPFTPELLFKNLTLGGYGELVFQQFNNKRQNRSSGGEKPRADLQRFVLELGYRFNDWIRFISEIEIEHAGSGEGSETRGEVGLEQAYMDFRLVEDRGWVDSLSARAGMLLIPMGIINEQHEPPTFHGVLRPSVERFVIPTTWRENGGGFAARLGPVSLKSYVVAGLAAKGTTDPSTDGFGGAAGIRGGRTEGSNSFAEDPASVSAVNVLLPYGSVGGSFYVGEADHGLVGPSVPVTLWETHGRVQVGGAELRALYASGRIGNADAVNAANGVAAGANTGIGRKLFGGYVEAAYDVLSLGSRSNGQYLAPFFRYERYDTQQGVPAGWTNDPANSRVEYTAGLTYKPIPQVAVKTDYQWKRNQARTGLNQWNLGLGFMF